MGVQATNNLNKAGKAIEGGAKEAFNTVATDVQRTSSDASPKDTGHLEQNHLNIVYGSGEWEAVISFRAMNGSFDYAEWTHEADYSLGPRSMTKAGGSSRFAGHVPVGKGYLGKVVDQGESNYINHIAETIKKSL